MSNLLAPLAGIVLAAALLTSCGQQQKPLRTFETGKIMKIKTGVIEKVTRLVVTRDAVGEGAFAEMASNAATAITPGLLASGTSKIASATGSLMDSKVETVAKLRIRVRMEDGELVEVLQNDVPGMSFKKGDSIVISTGDSPGNAWPE